MSVEIAPTCWNTNFQSTIVSMGCGLKWPISPRFPLNMTQSGLASNFAFILIILAEILSLPVALFVFNVSRMANNSFSSQGVN